MAFLSNSKGPQRLLNNTARWVAKKPKSGKSGGPKAGKRSFANAAKAYMKSRRKGK